MVTLTRHLPADPDATVSFTLPLTALERTRSRCRLDTPSGDVIYLHLPRGTVLRDRDLLQSEDGACLVRVTAKPEPVLTAVAPHPLLLLRSIYHLGNRHIPIEIAETYVRLSPDPVLQTLLEKMGLAVKAEIAPFQPETGAYGHNH